MSLYEKLCLVGFTGVVIALNVSMPILIPYTIAGMAIGGGATLAGHYIFGKPKPKVKQQKIKPELATEEIEIKTQTIDDIAEPQEFEYEEEQETEDEEPEYEKQKEKMTSRPEEKPKEKTSEFEEDDDIPTITKTPEGWEFFKCPPKTGQEGLYDYAMRFLSKNPELLITREKSLLDVEALDSNALFYYNHDKNKIYVISKKVPSIIEDWKAYGAKYIVQDIPSHGSIRLETMIEGVVTGKCIHLEKSLPETSKIMDSSIDIIRYLQKGVTLYLRNEEKR